MSIQTFISVDTETGGLFPDSNPLLSVGIGVYALDPATLVYTTVSENEWTLKPSQFQGVAVDPEAIRTNQLDLVSLERDGYLAADVAANICAVLDKAKQAGGRFHILGQNYAFDRGFLHKYIPDPAFHRLDINAQVDLMTLSAAYNAIVCPDWDHPPTRGLGSMCARLGVANEKAHSALADARATFLCYVALQKKFREIGRIVQITKDNVIRHNELNLLVSNLT